MSSLINNLEINRAKEKFKKLHFGRGIPCSFRDLLCRCKIWENHKYSFCLSLGKVHIQAAHKPIHVVAPEYCIDKRRIPSIGLYSQIWFKNLEGNKTSLAQFYNLQVLHILYYTMIILFSTHSCT